MVKELVHQGLRHLNEGSLGAAEQDFREALRLDPGQPDALHLLGLTLQRRGAKEEALAQINKAVAVRPDVAQFLLSAATVSTELGRFEEALAALDKALAIKPDFADALNSRGHVLHQLHRQVEALASFEQALALAPNHVDALNNRGALLYELKRYPDALSSYDRALQLAPGHAHAWSNRGQLLHEMQRYDEALASFDRALAARGQNVRAWVHRGNTLAELGRPREAIASYERAIAQDPNSADAHAGAAVGHLLLGDYERGWREYEWRWRLPEYRYDNPLPRWTGKEPLFGKTIALWAEQGLGDTLQFVRYAASVAKLGASVVLQVPAPLKQLVSGMPGVRVFGREEPIPHCDFHCPLLSLPLVLGTRLETIPAAIPYLSAPPGAVAKWRGILGPASARRVGIVWTGGTLGLHDFKRSLPFAAVAPLARQRVQLVSLQKEVRAADEPLLREHREILHFGAKLEDFTDTAALVSLMDLVISVDTSTAHLAGALGKPVWVLLSYSADWRWLLEREDSPWYPSARLFRQPRLGDWTSIIDQVAGNLAKP